MMTLLKVRNASPFPINLATCREGRLQRCFNHVPPGRQIAIQCSEGEGDDFIVMAAQDNQVITPNDDVLDVVARSIDSADKYGVLASHFIQGAGRGAQRTLLAAVKLIREP